MNQAADDGSIRVFARPEAQPLGAATGSAIDCSLTSNEVRRFERGEYKVRPLDGVGGADGYVVATLVAGSAASLSDQILTLLFLSPRSRMDARRG
jgi:ribose-phosphate pyrophosphokinase